MRHEQDAYAKAAPWVQTLKLRGYRLVQQLLPMSLMVEVLKHEEIPPDVIEACRVLVRALKSVKPLELRAPKVREDEDEERRRREGSGGSRARVARRSARRASRRASRKPSRAALSKR